MSTLTVSAADVLELEMQSIAAGGDGVGRANGLVVFVPRTAPGDLARIRVDSVKRFARGHLESLVRPSPDRVDPPCAHYTRDRCGGCQLQHIRYAAQLDAKQSIVRDSLQRIAKRVAEVPPAEPSIKEWRYRNKLTLAMRRERDGWTMGLHPYDDPASVFQLEDCPITDERVVGTWREIMNAAVHLPATAELRGTVRLAGDDLVVVISGGTEWPSSTDFFAAVKSATTLWWAADHAPPIRLFERKPVPAAAAFGQVNREVGELLHAHVVDRVASYQPTTVVDGYAGTGETATALASLGFRVTAIELDREAANLCATRLPAGSRSLVGRVESMIGQSLPADVVIVNPPRIGLHERVTTALVRRPAAKAIVYVSCDPATLARDLSRLPNYRIASIRTFDMFPQTAHVETVCELVPNAA
ncbi:MAG: class I SAM-dependent RNA methyltransferase [Gemmatimonadaceae bacterium]